MDRLEMKGIYQSFGGVHALKGVDLKVQEGEIHALIGENGAGKSTLMKVLSGAIQKDRGQIFIDGKEVHYSSPKEAISCGISVIYQELNMAPHLTVMENIFLGNFPQKRGLVQWKQMEARARELLDGLGCDIPVRAAVGDLRVASQQMVEIARAIKNQSKIIVFDEPSAVLGKQDSEILFGHIERLRQSGVSIIYISHRLDEILRLADKITVLRDGSYIATRDAKELTMGDLVSYMTGREYKNLWPERTERNAANAPVALEVRGLSRKGVIHNVSFQLHQGEVLGLAGLVGSGRSEIARAIFGADPRDSGEILIHGKPAAIRKPADAIQNGIGFVVEDRKTQGLLIEQAISDNITLTGLRRYRKGPYLNRSLEERAVGGLRDMLDIKTKNIRNPVNSLSGGNQQKVSIAKWLHINPDILFLDEPTRGVDVGAKSEIYRIIARLRDEGKAILLISSEFAEILGLSDRIIVIRRGEAAGEFTHDEAASDARVLEAFADQGGKTDEEI